MAWAILCNWWYLCKVKNLCDEPSKNSSAIGLLQAATPTHEPDEPTLIDKEAVPTKEMAEAPPEEMILSKEAGPAEDLGNPSTFTTLFQFGSDKIRLGREFNDWLSEIESQQANIQQIRITGHTCELGPDAYNLELGLKRAFAVKQLMIDKGFPGVKIEVKSKGKEAPLNANATDQDREQNRRAEIMIN